MSRRLDISLQLAAAVVALASAALVAGFGWGRDQGIYATVARVTLDGGLPYRDAFDFKPPGIYGVYALARELFGQGPQAIRHLEAGALVVHAWLMVRLADCWWGRRSVGALAAAISTLAHAQLDFWHTAQPESFGGMLVVGGLLTAWEGRSASSWRLFASGLLFGLAGLMKPPLAGAGAVVALWAARRDRLRPLALVLAGGVTPWALVLLWFWAHGGLGALVEIFAEFTPHYTALGWSERSGAEMLWLSLSSFVARTPGGILVGLGLALIGARFTKRKVGVGALAGILLVQLLGITLQAKFFPYHYGAIWPVAALLAALGWWWAWRAARPYGASVAAAALIAVALRTATPRDLPAGFWARSMTRAKLIVEPDVETRDGLATVADVDAGDNRRMARALSHQTPPDQPIFIWGFEPAIYQLAQRRPASRYIYNVPQRVPWRGREARQELLAELEERQPSAIVVEHRDIFPWVTGNALDSAGSLRRFSELRVILDERYRLARRVGDLDLYLLKSDWVRRRRR